MILTGSPSYSIFCPSCGAVMDFSIHNMLCPRCNEGLIYHIIWHGDEVHFLFKDLPVSYKIMDGIYVEAILIEMRAKKRKNEWAPHSLITYEDKEIRVFRSLLYSYQTLKRR